MLGVDAPVLKQGDDRACGDAGPPACHPSAQLKVGGGLTVADGPFYAIQVGLSYLNTNGGGDRTVDYQVNDWSGTPIPRLYEAGEFGSIFYHYYSGGGNICECFTSGMMAGQNVSALQAWA